AVRQAGRDLGEVLTTCVSLMNPSLILIGGTMAQAAEHLVAGVREVVHARSIPLSTEHPMIAPSRSAGDAAVLGAAHLAIDAALSPGRIAAALAAPAGPLRPGAPARSPRPCPTGCRHPPARP